jgi:hypothetical protein
LYAINTIAFRALLEDDFPYSVGPRDFLEHLGGHGNL